AVAGATHIIHFKITTFFNRNKPSEVNIISHCILSLFLSIHRTGWVFPVFLMVLKRGYLPNVWNILSSNRYYFFLFVIFFPLYVLFAIPDVRRYIQMIIAPTINRIDMN